MHATLAILASLTRWRMDQQIVGERADCQDQPLPFPNRSVALRGSCRGGSARLPCTNTTPHFLKLSHFIQPVGLYFRASNPRNLGWARSTRQLRPAGDRRRAAASRSEPGANHPENIRALRWRSFHEAHRDRSQPRRDRFAATARGQVAELGAIFSASHFVERTLPRCSPLGKNQKDSCTRDREAALSAKPGKRMAPARNSRATHCLRGVVGART